MSGIVVSSSPATEFITSAEVKLQARIDSNYTAEDTLIGYYIKAAREHVEKFTGRTMINTTFTWNLEEFPTTIVVPYAPLSSVTSVKYYDTEGTQQTLSTSVYTAVTCAVPGEIGLRYNQSWPSVQSRINAIEIIFVAGYGSAATNCPETLRHAGRALAAHWYENREAITDGRTPTEVPMLVERLLWNERLTFPPPIDGTL